MSFSAGKLIFMSNTYLKSKGFCPLTAIGTLPPPRSPTWPEKGSFFTTKSKVKVGGQVAWLYYTHIREPFSSHCPGAYCFTAD